MGEDKSAKKEKKEKKVKKEKKTESEAEEAPQDAAPEEEPKAEPKAEPKRAQRATSNVFALFNQAQIQEFKEAFTMMDVNRDGLICADDLRAIYANLGREPDMQVLESMVNEAPGPVNFTMFLNMFGEKTKGTDPESTLRDAFKMFDPSGTGHLAEEYVKDLLMNVGDQFSKDELKQTWKEAPIEGGQLDYLKFVQIIKRGKEDE